MPPHESHKVLISSEPASPAKKEYIVITNSARNIKENRFILVTTVQITGFFSFFGFPAVT